MTSESCSNLARQEPLAGTAPFARSWLVVEHPGPWGRDALTDSGLPNRFVERITHAQKQTPLRFLAARRLGEDRRHSSSPLADNAQRRVWLASCDAHEAITRSVEIQDVNEILEWDLLAFGNGRIPDIGDRIDTPLEFVCTHSRRDACCAIWGRGRIASVPSNLREQVWECSHLGGHRFAATSLFLPSGRLYGRLGEYSPKGQGRLVEPDPANLRGPSYLPAPLQAAECLVRQQSSVDVSQALTVTALETGPDDVVVSVLESAGRSWTVRCQAEGITAPASCGAQPKERVIWRALLVDEGAGG